MAKPDVQVNLDDELVFDAGDLNDTDTTDTYVLGNYTYKKAKTKRAYAPEDLLDRNWTEDEIAAIAYNKAYIVWNRNKAELLSYGIDEDDFIQDAVWHVLSKFKEGYFPPNYKFVDALAYRLINGFFIFNAKSAAVNKRNRVVSLNAPVSANIDNDGELLDKIQDTQVLTPEEEYRATIDQEADTERMQALIELGRDVLEEIVDQLSVVPISSRKYNYVATMPNLEDTEDTQLVEYRLTERNIGLMLAAGYSQKEIANIFGRPVMPDAIDVKYYSHHSAASFVQKRVREVLLKISQVALLDYSATEAEAVNAYFRYLEHAVNASDEHKAKVAAQAKVSSLLAKRKANQ